MNNNNNNNDNNNNKTTTLNRHPIFPILKLPTHLPVQVSPRIKYEPSKSFSSGPFCHHSLLLYSSLSFPILLRFLSSFSRGK